MTGVRDRKAAETARPREEDGVAAGFRIDHFAECGGQREEASGVAGHDKEVLAPSLCARYDRIRVIVL